MKEGRYEGSNQFGTAMAFFLIGASAGAITALLLTPKNGKQMRKALVRGYEDVKDNWKDWSEDIGDYAGDALDEVRGRSRSFARDAREAVGTARNTINDRLESLLK